MLFPALLIMNSQKDRTQNPADWVAKRHNDDTAGQVCGRIEIHLAEEHETAEHDIHGDLRVAESAQNTGIDLIDTGKEIRGSIRYL